MATWFNNEIRIYLRDKKWPKGYVPTIRSYPDGLCFLVNKEDLKSYHFDKADYEQLEKVFGESVLWIRQQGVPCYIKESVNG